MNKNYFYCCVKKGFVNYNRGKKHNSHTKSLRQLTPFFSSVHIVTKSRGVLEYVLILLPESYISCNVNLGRISYVIIRNFGLFTFSIEKL
jgi:hypothetical protein